MASNNSILHRALTNDYRMQQGVPDLRKQWIKLHYRPKARVQSEPLPASREPACRVVWDLRLIDLIVS